MTTKRHVLLVHGRNFKPDPATLLELSVAALRCGLNRDYPDQIDAFDALTKDIVWYGDLNAEVLHAAGKRYDEALDVGDRRHCLTALQALPARRKFSIRRYDSLPGKSAVPEFVANIVAPMCGSLGMSNFLMRAVAKDFCRYFDRRNGFAGDVRERLLTQLCEVLDRGEKLMLVSHGTGCVVAYDVLWQLSHDEALKSRYGDKKIELWLTMGAPLGDSNVKRRLLGAQEKSARKYPTNVISWHNVAAEDDYTCHDNTLADDFRVMTQERIVSNVKDYKIYNLAVRYGRSNPHSSLGYYVHPRVSKIFSDWLLDDTFERAVTGTSR